MNVRTLTSALLLVFILPVVFAAAGAGAEHAFAQEKQLQLDLKPSDPDAGERVTASVGYAHGDISRARIQWYVDGTLIEDGTGTRTFSFTAGNYGTQTRLRVTAAFPNGDFVSAQSAVRPAGVELLWQAHTTVPPFYRGKALPAVGGVITVAAFPQLLSSSGVPYSPDELFYAWEVNGSSESALSGRGAHSITFDSKRFSKVNFVSVSVSTRDKSITAYKRLELQAARPELLFYAESPLRGPHYARALRDPAELSGSELVLRAEPYFFPEQSNLAYDWSVNGSEVKPSRANPKLLTLIREGRTREEAGRVRLRLIDPANPLFRVEESLLIRI